MGRPPKRSKLRYRRFAETVVTLRDELAVDRTLLANERTLMAYLRSGVTLLLAAFTFIEIFSDSWLAYVGFAAVPIAAAVSIIGTIRYNNMRRAIDKVGRQLLEP